MTLTTVGSLIEGGARVTRSCQWCKDFGEVDLQRIAREKGADYPMLDHLPLCINGDCKGMIRFQAQRGMRSQWLMTPEGQARFQAHSDWLFQANIIERRRQAQRQRRAASSTRGTKALDAD
jgi:hypothetical protein